MTGKERILAANARFTVNGGMEVSRQESQGDVETLLHDYTRYLFASVGDNHHFLFASSCATSVLIPWQNQVYFRDAARPYGCLN